jgi:hypothetical protein
MYFYNLTINKVYKNKMEEKMKKYLVFMCCLLFAVFLVSCSGTSLPAVNDTRQSVSDNGGQGSSSTGTSALASYPAIVKNTIDIKDGDKIVISNLNNLNSVNVVINEDQSNKVTLPPIINGKRTLVGTINGQKLFAEPSCHGKGNDIAFHRDPGEVGAGTYRGRWNYNTSMAEVQGGYIVEVIK